MIIQDGSGGDVPVEDVVGNVIEGMLAHLVFVHVEGIVYFGRKDTLSPGLNGINGRS